MIAVVGKLGAPRCDAVYIVKQNHIGSDINV